MFKLLGKSKSKIDRDITLHITSDDKITNLDNVTMKLIYINLKKQYLEEIAALQHAISNMKTTLLYQNLKKNSIDLDYEKNNLKDMTCQICFDKPITRVLIPCGHLYCEQCIDNSYECFFCRKSISKIQPMYFS